MKSRLIVDTDGLNVILTSVASRINWLRAVAKDARGGQAEMRVYWDTALERAESLYADLVSGEIVSLVEEPEPKGGVAR